MSQIATAQTITFTGGSAEQRAVYVERPATSTGLNYLYVLYDAQGVTMNYTASDATAQVQWLVFDSKGGGYAQVLEGVVREGATTYKTDIAADCGYIIEEGTKRTSLWLVDYSKYPLRLDGVEVVNDSDCGTTTLALQGTGAEIPYYTINGVRQVMERGIEMAYNTLEPGEGNKEWVQTPVTKLLQGVKEKVSVPAILCNTELTVKGDKLLEYWGEPTQLVSTNVLPVAVNVLTTAVQTPHESDNIRGKDTGLGGSAPCEITFTAVGTDAVTHGEWQMSYDSNFEDIEQRFMQDVYVAYIEESGTTYWRFLGTNASGECVAESETYTVNVGESELLCPNAFSPQNQDGVNDVWKVSYRSLLSFECHIFNRWGVKMISFNNPDQGWDGRYNGKFVSPGAYYYVIVARGSDGKEYKMKGDINIVGTREEDVTPPPVE